MLWQLGRTNHGASRHIDLAFMATITDDWVGVSEASRRIGISPQAIRLRVLRGSIDSKRDNKNQLRVYAPATSAAATRIRPTTPPTAASPTATADVVSVLQAQIAVMRSDHAAEIARLVASYEARAARAENLAAGALEAAATASERIATQLITASSKPLWRRFLGI